MAQKTVIQTICDKCGTSEYSDDVKPLRNENLLPQGWVHVHVKTRTKDLLDKDLCLSCGTDLMKEFK